MTKFDKLNKINVQKKVKATIDKTNQQSQKEIDDVVQNALKSIIEKKKQVKEEEKAPIKKIVFKYDIQLSHKIDYFDPLLSYELTGYIPINNTSGLDFNPNDFRPSAILFEETGNYCTYKPGFKLYDDFWNQEYDRCENGYQVGKYRITGDNYYFLNYYRLQSPQVTGNRATKIRQEGFPSFFVEQYKWFHYVEMAEKLGYDVCALKPRGVGWSEIAASMGARLYTIKKQSTCIYTAQAEGQLMPTLSKCWDQMTFLDTQTNGGMRHLRMVKNTDVWKRASIKQKDGVEVGFKSEIKGIICDNPRKLRGYRVERIFFEESGSNTFLVKTFTQSEPLVVINGYRVGMRFVWGTGGDSGPQLEGLANIFLNPTAYEVFPYKHNYNQKREYVYTGFFIPAYSMVVSLMDNRGFCDDSKGKFYYDQIRLKKADDSSALLTFQSEYCYYPEEALIREGESRFDTEKLAAQLTDIELHKLYKPPIRGRLHSTLDKESGLIDLNQIPTFEVDPSGDILITEYPISDTNGIAYNNLYVAGIDSIDADESSASGQKDVSQFCITIKKRQFGLQEPKYVAMYLDRPKDVRTAYLNAIKLLMWYNCKAVLESSRVGLLTYFKEKNKLNLLFKRPKATLGNIVQRDVKQYGAIASEKVIYHQLELIENFVIDYSHTIEFPEMIRELLKYSYERKRKFDIVAAMGMAELADEELSGIQPRSRDNKREFRDIGYFYENGVKKFGVIPQNYSYENNKTHKSYEWIDGQN